MLGAPPRRRSSSWPPRKTEIPISRARPLERQAGALLRAGPRPDELRIESRLACIRDELRGVSGAACLAPRVWRRLQEQAGRPARPNGLVLAGGELKGARGCCRRGALVTNDRSCSSSCMTRAAAFSAPVSRPAGEVAGSSRPGPARLACRRTRDKERPGYWSRSRGPPGCGRRARSPSRDQRSARRRQTRPPPARSCPATGATMASGQFINLAGPLPAAHLHRRRALSAGPSARALREGDEFVKNDIARPAASWKRRPARRWQLMPTWPRVIYRSDGSLDRPSHLPGRACGARGPLLSGERAAR